MGASGLSLPAVPVFQAKTMDGDGSGVDGSQKENTSVRQRTGVYNAIQRFGAKPVLQEKGRAIEPSVSPVVQRLAFSSKDLLSEAKAGSHWFRGRVWFALIKSVKKYEAEADDTKKKDILEKMLGTTKSWKDKNKEKTTDIKKRKRAIIEELEAQIAVEKEHGLIKGDSTRQDEENAAKVEDPMAKIMEQFLHAKKKGEQLAAFIGGGDEKKQDDIAPPKLRDAKSKGAAEEEFANMTTTFEVREKGTVTVSSKGASGLYINTYTLATGAVTASENVRADKSLVTNADVFYLQWNAARKAKVETGNDPGITQVTRTPNNWLTRAIMRIGVKGVDDVKTKVAKKTEEIAKHNKKINDGESKGELRGFTGESLGLMFQAPPDSGYTYRANKEIFEVLLGTANGQSVGYLVADRMKEKSISKIEISGGNLVFTIE